ncbi:unnamed protein product, partial [Mesorhabditis spiculigera]
MQKVSRGSAPCRNGCGKQADEECDGHCKNCYNTLMAPVQKYLDLETDEERVINPFTGEIEGAFENVVGTSTETNYQPIPEAITTKVVNRCGVCKKRVGLLGFICLCGGQYCVSHRYDSAHDCKVDYQTLEREKLRKAMPKFTIEKIQKL